jgi:hypothetical protein
MTASLLFALLGCLIWFVLELAEQETRRKR